MEERLKLKMSDRRKEYAKLLDKCFEWRRKYGMKFKHIPAGR